MIDDNEIYEILQKHKACRSLREINAIKEILNVQQIQYQRISNKRVDSIIELIRASANVRNIFENTDITEFKLDEQPPVTMKSKQEIHADVLNEVERINNLRRALKPPYNFYESPWDYGTYTI